MDVAAKGQVGGIESGEGVRRRLAGESRNFTCATCGKSNVAILQEQEELARESEKEGGERKEEVKVPEELKLAYKDELKPAEEAGNSSKSTSTTPSSQPATTTAPKVISPSPAAAAQVATVPPQRTAPAPRGNANADDVRLDAAIWVISGLLVILISRLLIRMML
jgi:ubiquitin-conjugating enzyme E2 J1